MGNNQTTAASTAAESAQAKVKVPTKLHSHWEQLYLELTELSDLELEDESSRQAAIMVSTQLDQYKTELVHNRTQHTELTTVVCISLDIAQGPVCITLDIAQGPVCITLVAQGSDNAILLTSLFNCVL